MAESYRLEAVLTLRQRAEDEAKEELARKLRALKAEEDELQRRRDALAEHQRRRAAWMKEQIEKAANGALADDLQLAGRYGDRLRDEEIELRDRIPPQEERVEAAKRDVEAARLQLVEAQKQKRAIEQHKEQWVLERKKAREAREEIAMDEIGQAIHDRVRRGG
jgi:flagellar export protein FliJ